MKTGFLLVSIEKFKIMKTCSLIGMQNEYRKRKSIITYYKITLVKAKLFIILLALEKCNINRI